MKFDEAPWGPAVSENIQAVRPVRSWVQERLASIPTQTRALLSANGLQVLDNYDQAVAGVLLERSLNLIAEVPDLHRQVLKAVGTIHLLSADPGYDVSHSEPQWRSTIFVSLPDREDMIGVLRLAESIIHEAMHLTLTNWEMEHPFVNEDAAMQYSPWRDTQRSAQGVLHGVFVFVCIAVFLRRLPRTWPDPETTHYVRERMETIQSELALVDLVRLRRSLTKTGATALAQWFGAQEKGVS